MNRAGSLLHTLKLKMAPEEVLKAVFPLLEGQDLATCMVVCKHWREVAGDDYFWKCVCAKRWPSVCDRSSPPNVSYKKFFQTFHNYKHQHRRTIIPPRLCFNDLEFYIDIWNADRPVFSKTVMGHVLQAGIKNPPPGISSILKFQLEGPECRMTVPVEPNFSIPSGQTLSVSVLVGRMDMNKIACIINRSLFDYVDRTAYRALAFDYLDFSPLYPFISGIRAWIALLFMEGGGDGGVDVFGIQMDFCDVASSEDEVLWLLDMLDWK